MKARIAIVAVGMLLLAGVARAQVEGERTRIGVGVSLAPTALLLSNSQQSSYLPVGLGNVFFPILIGRAFKLEAEVGVLHASSETSGTGTSSSDKSTSLRLGMGAFKVTPLGGGATLMYVGPRVGLISTSTSSTSPGSGTEYKTSETDWVFGIALGGEHFLSQHFSLGGELQLNYVSFGQPKNEPSQGTQPTISQSMISSNGLLFARLYF